jgi:methionyl-tRNA formyltransferase
MTAWEQRAKAARGEPLPIVKVGEPGAEILRKQCRPVRNVNRSLKQLVDRMWATMYAARGAGLAAPQVGVDQRVLVADAGDRFCVLVNPEIVSAQGSQLEPMEGCLSIPDLTGEAERAQSISLRGMGVDGRQVWIDAEGFFARVLQHEVDHLNGVLFTDRARRTVRATPESKLQVVFLGSSVFGVTVLDALLQGGVTPAAVLTRPDRPAGRGLKSQPTPVREAAEAAGLQVWTPDRARGPELVARLRDLNPDVLVTAAYGQIVASDVLALPRLAALNVHPSALPLYRGPDPVRRAVWDGQTETAVTVQFMVDKVDAGDILLQEPAVIGPDEDAGALSARLAAAGGRLLLTALHQLATGTAAPKPQDHDRATYAPKIAPEEEFVDFSLAAATLAQRVRALAPRPGLRTPGGLKLLAASARPEGEGVPGTVLAVEGEDLVVAAGSGALVVREVQPSGGRRMSAGAWARGRRLHAGERLV